MTPPPRPAREPIFHIPAPVALSILGLVAVHALRTWFLDGRQDFELLFDLAVIPVRWTGVIGGYSPGEIVAALGGAGDPNRALQVEIARYVVAQGSAKLWTALTYALLHGSWPHVVLNSIWLAAFGTPVARRFGAVRYGLLVGATAAGGALAHALLHPFSALPMIGASAAVSGMMAAAAWFMFAPRSWLLEGRPAEPHERPREHLADIVRNRRVVTFLAVWLATNWLSAVLAQPLGVTDASIAWEAHVGGFLVGLLLFPLLDPVAPRSRRGLA
jgi:membrane associated rhomboid family serine protease